MKQFIKKLRSFFIRNRRKVLVHSSSGDFIAEVQNGNIINVPWFGGLSNCPFHLEQNGAVILLLKYGSIKSNGYGKTYKWLTWKEVPND